MVPLVVLSKDKVGRPGDLALYGKPAVLVMANIHAGEVEGKEASLMLIRDIALGRFPGLLDTQVLLFIPIFNADGNDKLGHNRRDLGPELAGVRFNGQNLDLNRDYLKLESPGGAGPGRPVQRLGPGADRGHAHHQRLLPPRAGDLFDPAQPQQRQGAARLHVAEALSRRRPGRSKPSTATTACPTAISSTASSRKKAGRAMPWRPATAPTTWACATASASWTRTIPMPISRPASWPRAPSSPPSWPSRPRTSAPWPT